MLFIFNISMLIWLKRKHLFDREGNMSLCVCLDSSLIEAAWVRLNLPSNRSVEYPFPYNIEEIRITPALYNVGLLNSTADYIELSMIAYMGLNVTSD